MVSNHTLLLCYLIIKRDLIFLYIIVFYRAYVLAYGTPKTYRINV